MFVVAVTALVAATTDVFGQRRPVDFSLAAFSGIDHCSNDSSVIVLVDCGTINQADSLLLFDITIRYPASKLVFKQPLFQNTLSENLETKSSGSRDTGEIRVYGFNVQRFISGKKPLVALLFKHKVECTDSIVVNFAVLPEVNPEAKIYVREVNGTTLPISTPYQGSRSLKVQFSNDTIVLKPVQETVFIPLDWTVSNSDRVKSFSLEVTSTSSFVIDSAIAKSSHALRFTKETGKATVEVKSTSFVPLSNGSIELQGRVPIKEQEAKGSLMINKAEWDTCACLSAFQGDTVRYTREAISAVDVFSNRVNIASDGDVWEIENVTAGPVRCMMYSVQGQQVWESMIESADRFYVSTKDWPQGAYLIAILDNSGSCIQTKKVCK